MINWPNQEQGDFEAVVATPATILEAFETMRERAFEPFKSISGVC
jgi:hypothetical protein